MAVFCDNPIVIPETIVPEKNFNIWWFTEIEIQAPDPTPNAPMTAKVKARLSCVNADGSREFHPTEPEREFTIQDLFGQAAALGAQLALGLEDATNAIGAIGKRIGSLT